MSGPRVLWIVKTRFGFAEIFVARPTRIGYRFWHGRCLYTFDPLTVWALGWRRLQQDVPRRLELLPAGYRLRCVKVTADELRIERRIGGIWIRVIRFCDRMIQAVGLDDAPDGSIVFPTFTN